MAQPVSCRTAAVPIRWNQNFQAVNARQAATLASLAGTCPSRSLASSRQVSCRSRTDFWNGTTTVTENTSRW